MGIVATRSKTEATLAFINTWLLDPTLYCVTCGKAYREKRGPCCETPNIMDRITRVAEFVRANNEEKALLYKASGASRGNHMRASIRMPEELYRDIEKYFKTQYGEEFLSDKREARAFMKAFPQFCACREV